MLCTSDLNVHGVRNELQHLKGRAGAPQLEDGHLAPKGVGGVLAAGRCALVERGWRRINERASVEVG